MSGVWVLSLARVGAQETRFTLGIGTVRVADSRGLNQIGDQLGNGGRIVNERDRHDERARPAPVRDWYDVDYRREYLAIADRPRVYVATEDTPSGRAGHRRPPVGRCGTHGPPSRRPRRRSRRHRGRCRGQRHRPRVRGQCHHYESTHGWRGQPKSGARTRRQPTESATPIGVDQGCSQAAARALGSASYVAMDGRWIGVGLRQQGVDTASTGLRRGVRGATPRRALFRPAVRGASLPASPEGVAPRSLLTFRSHLSCESGSAS